MQSRKIRRLPLAKKYDVNPRTIDAWSRTGVIPAPQRFFGSIVPFWDEDEVERCLTNKSQSEKVT